MNTFARYAALCALCAGFAMSPAAEARLKRITIGANQQGSVLYLLASGFAQTLQETLNVRAIARPHAGSTAYLSAMDKGRITLGLNNSMDSGAAVRGQPPFRRKMRHIRAIAMVWTIPYAVMVKASSGIASIGDLKGRSFVARTGRIVTLTNLNIAYLHSGGLSVSDVAPVTSDGIVDNIAMVVDGRADAAAVPIGIPAVREAHASVPGGIRILPLGAGGSDDFLAREVPGARSTVVNPGKRVPYVGAPTRIAAFDAYLNAGKQVSREDAYRIIKTLHTNWANMQQAYGPLRGLEPSDIAPASNPHPYHAGVVKYLKEVGLWSAANEKQQQAALAAAR